MKPISICMPAIKARQRAKRHLQCKRPRETGRGVRNLETWAPPPAPARLPLPAPPSPPPARLPSPGDKDRQLNRLANLAHLMRA
jgi:hypothetical protein